MTRAKMYILLILYILLVPNLCLSIDITSKQSIDNLFSNSEEQIKQLSDDSDELAKNDPKYKSLAKKQNLSPEESRYVYEAFEEYRCKKRGLEYEQLIKANASKITLITFNDKDCHKCQAKNAILDQLAKKFGIKFMILRPVEYMGYRRDNDIQDDPLAQRIHNFFDPNLQDSIIEKLDYPILVHYKMQNSLMLLESSLGNLKDSCTIVPEMSIFLSMFKNT